jgi:hypothetical protein
MFSHTVSSPLPDVRDKTSPNQSMMAERSMVCTCKKSKIGEVLPLLLCYTVPCAEDQLKVKAPWHENVIQAKVFVADHNDEAAKKTR